MFIAAELQDFKCSLNSGVISDALKVTALTAFEAFDWISVGIIVGI